MKQMKLLSNPMVNYKAKKNLKLKVHSWFLSLAPSDISGYNVCPMANKVTQGENHKLKSSCSSVCVAHNGNGRYPVVINARIRKTKLYFEDRNTFMSLLIDDITEAIKESEKAGYIPTFRLNAYSDIMWENIRFDKAGLSYKEGKYNGKNIFEIFPDITFYDYTKIANRKVDHIPNYDLTFSYSGVKEYQPFVQQAIDNGLRIAVVFKHKDRIPAQFLGMDCVDGDDSDIRPYDPQGVVVALYAKGKARNDTSGFVVDNTFM
jgi:hypothetical protein